MRAYWYLLLSISLAVAFFLGDLFISIDVAGGVLYVVAVLVTIWTPHRRLTDAVALLSTAFLFVGFMVGPGSAAPWVEVMNRILGLLAVWLTAGLVAERRRIEDELRGSESKIRSILNATADAIVSLDSKDRIETFNPAVGTIFGMPADWIGERPMVELADGASAGDLKDYLGDVRRHARNGEGVEIVGRRADGSTFPMHVTLTSSDLDGRQQITGVLRDLSQQRLLEQEVMRASELERQRIGHELHEGLGQMLTGIGLIVRSMYHKLRAEHSPLADEASQVVEFLQEADEYTRELSLGLVPLHQDDTGLSYALQRLADNASEQFGIECEYTFRGRPLALDDPMVAAHLYQIAQEAIAALVRSAKPDRVWLVLAGQRTNVCLTIEDDGTETHLDAEDPDGLPWENVLAYRARLIGASLKSQRDASGGRISCTLPRREAHSDVVDDSGQRLNERGSRQAKILASRQDVRN